MNPLKIIQYVSIPLLLIGLILSFVLLNVIWFILSIALVGIFSTLYIANIYINYVDDVENFYDQTIGDVENVLRQIQLFIQKNEFAQFDPNITGLYEYLNSYKKSLVHKINDNEKSKLGFSTVIPFDGSGRKPFEEIRKK